MSQGQKNKKDRHQDDQIQQNEDRNAFLEQYAFSSYLARSDIQQKHQQQYKIQIQNPDSFYYTHNNSFQNVSSHQTLKTKIISDYLNIQHEQKDERNPQIKVDYGLKSVDKLSKTVKNLMRSNEQYRQQLLSAYNKKTQNELKNVILHQKINNLQNQKETLLVQNDQLGSMISGLQKQLHLSKQNAIISVKRLQEQINTLQKESDVFRDKNFTLSNLCNEYSLKINRIPAIQQQLKDSHAKHDKLSLENQELKVQLDKVSHKYEELREQQRNLLNTCNYHLNNYQHARQEINYYKDNLAKYNICLADFQNNSQKLQKENLKLEHENREILNKKNQEIQKLKRILQHISSSLKEREEAILLLNKKLDKELFHEQQNTYLHQRLLKQQKQNKRLIEEEVHHTKIKRQLQHIKVDHGRLIKDYDSLNEQFNTYLNLSFQKQEQVKKQMRINQQSYFNRQNQVNKLCHGLEEQIKRLINVLLNKQEHIRHLENEHQEYQHQQQHQKSLIEQALRQKFDEKDHQNTQLSGNLISLIQKIKQADENNISLKKQSHEIRQNLNQVQQQKKKLQILNEAKKQENMKLKEELLSSNEQIKRLNTQNNLKTAELTKLKEDLFIKINNIATMRQKMSQFQKQLIDNIEQLNNKYNVKAKDYEKERTKMMMRYTSLQEEIQKVNSLHDNKVQINRSLLKDNASAFQKMEHLVSELNQRITILQHQVEEKEEVNRDKNVVISGLKLQLVNKIRSIEQLKKENEGLSKRINKIQSESSKTVYSLKQQLNSYKKNDKYVQINSQIIHKLQAQISDLELLILKLYESPPLAIKKYINHLNVTHRSNFSREVDHISQYMNKVKHISKEMHKLHSNIKLSANMIDNRPLMTFAPLIQRIVQKQ